MARNLKRNEYYLKPNRPTPQEVDNELTIDSNGILWWRKRKSGRFFNCPAGSNTAEGYLAVQINGTKYKAHTLAFVLYYGRWPEFGKVINHLNGDRKDNRKCNLQETSHQDNIRHRISTPENNTSGVRGVSWSKLHQKWRPKLVHNGKSYYNGLYDSIEKAALVYNELAAKFGHNEFNTRPMLAENYTFNENLFNITL